MKNPNMETTASNQNMIECYSPLSGAHLGQVPIDDATQVKDAVDKARLAQKIWAETSFGFRKKFFKLLQSKILDQADDLCRAVVEDAGKTMENAMMGEIWPVCEKLRWINAKGARYLKPERVSSGMFLHKKARIEFQPLGVVGIIAPWNYPMQNILGPVIPALMAGNACVVKVSEAVAWSSLRVKRLLDECFQEMGLPKDLVGIVNGYGQTGEALIKSGVNLVIFTGSMPNGRKIISSCAENLTPMILELGGKDPMIICDDADLEQATHTALGGVFIACGQNCLSAERIFVQEGIYDAFVAKVVAMTQALKQGSSLEGPVDVGAIVSPIQLKLIENLVNDAVSKGATVLAGGKIALADKGQYFEPTILTDVTDDMLISHEETFGPVMVIYKYKTDQEVLARANGVEYGLSSSVFSKDLKRARNIAKQIQAGSSIVNDFGIVYMAQDLPFGGVKGSGFGRLNGRDGLRAMTNPKSVLDDRFPLHIPPKLFPVTAQSYPQAKATINMLYRKGIKNKIHYLKELMAINKS